MTLFLYQTSVPLPVRALDGFSGIPGRAVARAVQKKTGSAVFVNARPAPVAFARTHAAIRGRR